MERKVKIIKADYKDHDGKEFSHITIGKHAQYFYKSELLREVDVTDLFFRQEIFMERLRACVIKDLVLHKVQGAIELLEYISGESEEAECALSRETLKVAKNLFPDAQFLSECIVDCTDEESEEIKAPEVWVDRDYAWMLVDVEKEADNLLAPLLNFLSLFKEALKVKNHTTRGPE